MPSRLASRQRRFSALRATLSAFAVVCILPSCGAEESAPAEASFTAKSVNFLDQYAVAAEFPEGGAYDQVAGIFYFGSLKDGSLHQLDAETGKELVVFTETELGTWWTLGMDVDLTRRRLWVCMDRRDDATSSSSHPAEFT